MQATITRNGKKYRLSTAEMLEAARCLRINFMQDELERQFNVPKSKSKELAIKADELLFSISGTGQFHTNFDMWEKIA